MLIEALHTIDKYEVIKCYSTTRNQKKSYVPGDTLLTPPQALALKVIYFIESYIFLSFRKDSNDSIRVLMATGSSSYSFGLSLSS